MKTKVLILGASGFMGRNITERFYSNPQYEVFTVGHTNVAPYMGHPTFITTDLTIPFNVIDIFSSIHPDIVIQAAATTSGSKDIVERPYIHVTDNAVMNSLILRACYEFNVKHFIFLSCGVMYQPGDLPRKEKDFNESDEIHKTYFGVGWMKVYVEKQCEFYASLGRTKHTVIRHSNTYGPYDKYDLEHSHMFGATVRKVMDAKDGDIITVWGNGEDTARDLIYVSDVVEFITKALQKQITYYELYNVSAGKAFTVKQVVEKIIKVSGKNLTIAYDNSKPSIPTKLALSFDKAFHDFDWYPATSLEEGIQKTLSWYRNCFGVSL